jgi:hypothetical protein
MLVVVVGDDENGDDIDVPVVLQAEASPVLQGSLGACKGDPSQKEVSL